MIVLLAEIAVAAAAVRVAWVDCRRLVIEHESLAVLAAAAAAALWIDGGLARIGLGAGCAGVLTAALAAFVRLGLVRRPGAGDWPLVAACGFLAAGRLPVFAAALAGGGLAMALARARRCRRALLRVRFPLAPPALAAAVLAFLLRPVAAGSGSVSAIVWRVAETVPPHVPMLAGVGLGIPVFLAGVAAVPGPRGWMIGSLGLLCVAASLAGLADALLPPPGELR